jgi:hypothetical protein
MNKIQFPFLIEDNSSYSIDELMERDIIEAGIDRIKWNINRMDYNFDSDKEEFLSYPASRVILSVIGDNRILEMNSKGEAKRMRNLLLNKELKDIQYILNNFDIKLEKEDITETYQYKIFQEEIEDKYEFALLKNDTPDKVMVNPYNESHYYKKYHNKDNKISLVSISLNDFTRISSQAKIFNWDLYKNGLKDGRVILESGSELLDFVEETIMVEISKNLPYDVPKEISKRIKNTEVYDKPVPELVEELIPNIDYSYETDEEVIKKALEHIDSDCSYEKWRNIGFAISDYYEDDEKAKEVYRNWSKRGSKYDEDAKDNIDDIIESPKEERDEVITIGTLIYHAKQEGFNPKNIEDEDDKESNKDDENNS